MVENSKTSKNRSEKKLSSYYTQIPYCCFVTNGNKMNKELQRLRTQPLYSLPLPYLVLCLFLNSVKPNWTVKEWTAKRTQSKGKPSLTKTKLAAKKTPLPSLRRGVEARNVSFRVSLRWPIHIKTKLLSQIVWWPNILPFGHLVRFRLIVFGRVW